MRFSLCVFLGVWREEPFIQTPDLQLRMLVFLRLRNVWCRAFFLLKTFCCQFEFNFPLRREFFFLSVRKTRPLLQRFVAFSHQGSAATDRTGLGDEQQAGEQCVRKKCYFKGRKINFYKLENFGWSTSVSRPTVPRVTFDLPNFKEPLQKKMKTNASKKEEEK